MFTIAFGTKGHGLTLAECSTYPDCLDLISILTTTNQIKKNIKNQQNFSNDQNFNKNLTHK